MPSNPRKRAARARYHVGDYIAFNKTVFTRAGEGTITAVTQRSGMSTNNGTPVFLYRVELANGYGAFGNSTRFVFESDIARRITTANKKAEAA